MERKTKGASAAIKREQPSTYFVHFRNPCINLAITLLCKKEIAENLGKISNAYHCTCEDKMGRET